MSPWAKKRKLIVYGIILTVILSISISYLLGKLLKDPTCFDGKKNGTEKGIDCGGTCKLACTNEYKDVKISWAKSIEISGDVYNIAALVENTNKDYRVDIDYKFNVFSNQGTSIWTSTDKISLNPLEKRVIFKPFQYLGKNVIKNTFFEITNSKAYKNTGDLNIDSRKITHYDYKVTNNIPVLSTIISNNTPKESGKLEVVGIVYDKNLNIINFSNSIIDSIKPRKSKKVYFTWQKKFEQDVHTFKIFVSEYKK